MKRSLRGAVPTLVVIALLASAGLLGTSFPPVAAQTTTPEPTSTSQPATAPVSGTASATTAAPSPTATTEPAPETERAAPATPEPGPAEGDFGFPPTCAPTFSLCARFLTLQVNAQPDTSADFGFTITQDGTNQSVTTRVAEGEPDNVFVPRNASYRVRLTGLADRYVVRSVRCTGIRQSVSNNVVIIENGNPLTDNTVFRPDNGDITCTFTVRRPGSIQIRQTSSPSADEDFTYTGSGPGFSTRFVLDNDSLGSDRNEAPSSQTLGGLEVGDYSFAVAPRAGFRLTALTCDNGESPNLEAGRVDIALSQGEDVICRFRFTELGSVRVTLDVRPDDPVDVAFDLSSIPGGGTVTLDDDGLVGSGRPSNTVRLTGLLPGTFFIRQTTDLSSAGIDLTAITCTEPVDATSLATRRVDVRLGAGEDLVCTFRNDRRGSITIIEDSRPDGPRDYPYTDSGAATGFTLDDDADPDFANSITFDGVRAGTTRTFTQGLPGGTPPWLLVGIQCVSGGGVTANVPSRSVTVTVQPGRNTTCTFDNAQFLPDALVGPTRTGPFVGDEVRAATPLAEQTIEESVGADGRTTTIVVKLQNDSGLTDELLVNALESGNGGFTTTYRSGGVDITAQVLSPGGFQFDEVPSGGERLIAIDFTSQTGSVPGTARKSDIAVRSGTAPDAVDVVRARARRT